MVTKMKPHVLPTPTHNGALKTITVPSDTLNESNTLAVAKEVIRIEAEAVANLTFRLDAAFEQAVDCLFDCKGRVIVLGMGKSGIIAQKIAATLSSTGTSAVFVHPAEAAHGDIGFLMPGDMVICISKSGHTEEFYVLLPLFKQLNIPIIVMTGDLHSPLAERADVVLNVSVAREACPHDLAPTASTTAALAMGDALAVALLVKRKFTEQDFAQRHPAGALGRKLLLRIDEVMYSGDKIARVPLTAPIDEIIMEITAKRFGATCVMNSDDTLAGLITDGDLRRLLRHPESIVEVVARDIMTRNPRTVPAATLASRVVKIMEDSNIMQMVVVDELQRPIGMIHLHDLLKIGIS